MNSFANKVALITGGTSGIGRATAIAFAEAGAKVVVAGRRIEEGQQTVEQIKAAGGQGIFVRTDVSKEADVQALVAATIKAYGRLDIAFNNAGVEHFGPLVDTTEADYRRLFDINVFGTLLSLKYEIPEMLKAGGGAIVNTSSIAGLISLSGLALYTATKHAVIGLTKGAALEHAKQNIRVNAVAPASIETEMLDRIAGSPEVLKYFASLHPIGRIGKSSEVASAVLWLCSDGASFVTGQTLGVDGGFTAQ